MKTNKLTTAAAALLLMVASCSKEEAPAEFTWKLVDSTLTFSGQCPMPDYEATSGFFPPWLDDQYGIRTVVINDGITNIGDCAFNGCALLTSVTIPKSVTNIGYRAFFYCQNLAAVTIPNSVTKIEFSAFYSCRKLTTITIPNSVTSIGYEAFSSCRVLSTIHVSWSNPDTVKLGNYAFSSSYWDDDGHVWFPKLYVPSAALTAYKASAQWQRYFFGENIIGE